MDQPDLATLNANQGTFGQHLGIEIISVDEDAVRAVIDCDERHHQPYGIVHGGVYASVVESVGSMAGALRAHPSIVVGVSNTTEFFRPHRTGRLDVEARPVHLGRLQHVWHVSLTREDGKLVAEGRLRLQVLPPDRELAGSPASHGT